MSHLRDNHEELIILIAVKKDNRSREIKSSQLYNCLTKCVIAINVVKWYSRRQRLQQQQRFEKPGEKSSSTATLTNKFSKNELEHHQHV